jgi:hypothetical protein
MGEIAPCEDASIAGTKGNQTMSTLSNPTGRAGALENVLWAWLAAGTLACLVIPSLRVHDALFGWLPFWLVAVPLIDLGVLHRNRLAAASTLLVRRMRRRRPARQARRLRRDQSLMPRRFFSMRRRNSDMMRRYKSSPR